MDTNKIIYKARRSLILVLILPEVVLSQNLILNGSFEDFSACPDHVNRLSLAKGWYSPTNGTPDYFNRCDTTGSVGVPYNYDGFQDAIHGEAYAGLYLVSNLTIEREYIQTKLQRSLLKGEGIAVTFYISSSEGSFTSFNKISIGFSKGSPKVINYRNCTSDSKFKPACQILKCENKVVLSIIHASDKENWIELKGTYFAKGGEDTLTIGLFDGDISENEYKNVISEYIENLEALGRTNEQIDDLINFANAYYYIDNITVHSIEFSH
jgi:hypothetical protein